MILGFTFASFMIAMNKEPRFKGIGLEKCKQVMSSYPNGLSVDDVDRIFKTQDVGDIFFKRDSTVFMMNVNEKEVVLKHMISNEYNIERFCSAYFDVKGRVEFIDGTFKDERFGGS